MVNISARWFPFVITALLSLSFIEPPLRNGGGKEKIASNTNTHPFYVSMIDIAENTKTKSVEISIRVFTDDLEKTLRKYGNAKIDVLHPTDKAALDKLINDYVQHKLQIKLDGKPATMHYVGHEQQMESIWTYLEVENVASFKKVEVNCSLLYDYQESQINIFHVKESGLEKSYKLDCPQTRFELEMN